MNIKELRFLKGLGDRVREARQAQSLTQAELANKCGLHRTFIGSVEQGERNVSVLGLRLIARVLRISMVELLKGVG